eukprot:GILJ01008662.1.p5 GENE.GILJ01008662.1~~GILJ01008662.1.p5  ORF type:complete len:104 (-),score=25.69 GILJ01008662.1:1546-1857(-)
MVADHMDDEVEETMHTEEENEIQLLEAGNDMEEEGAKTSRDKEAAWKGMVAFQKTLLKRIAALEAGAQKVPDSTSSSTPGPIEDGQSGSHWLYSLPTTLPTAL